MKHFNKIDKLSSQSNLVIGSNAICEIMNSDISLIKKVIKLESNKNYISQRQQIILDKTGKMSIPTQTLAKKEFIRLAGNKAQGIAAYIKEYKYYQLEDLINKNKKFQPNLNKSVKVILALDSITDPHNLGAIIRSAVAFGVENIIITKHKSAQVTPSVWKASAGQVSKVRIAKVSSLTNALKILKKSGYFVIGLDGQAKDNISQINIDNQPTVLVFGSEGKGISYLALQTCDITAKIPIDKKVESLNVSVAAGITLWELFTCDENIYTN